MVRGERRKWIRRRKLAPDRYLVSHFPTRSKFTILSTIQSYPPTHKHLRLLLARLRTYSTAVVDGSADADMKVCLARAPTLLVLHELSRYFLTPKDGEDEIKLSV